MFINFCHQNLILSINNTSFCYFRRLCSSLLPIMSQLSNLKAILIDLSGTLHIEDSAIPGAVEALERLRKTQIPIRFVTNTTKESRRRLHERLINAGFKIDISEIWSSLSAARDLIERQNLRPYLLVDDDAMEDFEDLVDKNKKCNSVVVGLAPSKFNYKDMNEAFRILIEGAPLIAIHESRYYKKENGLALGPGPFVKGLEYASGVKAEIVGKPAATFYRTALRSCGDVEPKNAIMIGDDVQIDVWGAQVLGMKGILVKTGKYLRGDEQTIEPKPYAVVKDFPEAVNLILRETS